MKPPRESHEAEAKVSESAREERDLKAERDYLWNAIAQIEAWAKAAPDSDLPRVRRMIMSALDSFKPAVKVERVMP